MSETPSVRRADDPWVAVGRIGGGVLVYGALGYLLDLWWGTSFMVAIGLVGGAVLGLITVFVTTRLPSSEGAETADSPPDRDFDSNS